MIDPTTLPCDCCTGIGEQTPALIWNRPGLSAIAYRVGTHASFKASMLGALSRPDFPALAPLTAREDDDFSLDATRIGQLLAVNLHAPLAIVHALLPRLIETRGVVVLFGSVAAVRGRGRNVVYAGAKRALVSLYESLRQRYASRELRVQMYKLGFLSTNLTYGTRLPLPAADPQAVARTVVLSLRRGSFSRHLPRWWALVALLVRWLPWPVYRRMKS